MHMKNCQLFCSVEQKFSIVLSCAAGSNEDGSKETVINASVMCTSDLEEGHPPKSPMKFVYITTASDTL